MGFGVKRGGMVYGKRGVTPGLFGIHIPIIDDVLNTAGKLAAATGLPGISQLGRAADLAVRDRPSAGATKSPSTAVQRVSSPPIIDQVPSSQTPFPSPPQQVPSTGARIDINPPFAGPPGVGVDFSAGAGRVPATSSGAAMNGNGKLGPVSVAPAVFSETVRRCPTGWVLAIDENCYPKSMVPRSMRKWKPRRKPPITRRKWKALLDAASAENAAKRVAEKAGFVVRKRKS